MGKSADNSSFLIRNFELNLPPVSEMMRAAGIRAKKSLGQNFLFDLNLTRKIARSVPDLENSVVLEVGPGPGGLTRAFLECGAKKIIAIEKDKSTKPILDEIQRASDGRLDIIYGDATRIQNLELKVQNYVICANLPYNIGTELLANWLHFPDKIKSMTLMFQREVAERIIAKPGTKQYGRLSVLRALNWKAKILFNIPNSAFIPHPKVQSSVVQLLPRSPRYRDELVAKTEKLTAVLFGNRRKMIRAIIPDLDWSRFGLTGMERAEELNPEKFVEIAETLFVFPSQTWKSSEL
ncbi:MAG: 16S rRNA (adenine(1518)-N(6)/adenine(1519)-N(6))-dimethyltransferase RsmA [Rickettsiales bacterium]|jgi:16S rRNA (adenine1518-N6/adenine1519-N6)-dimethyltransferase|nr:16S rRNA (adenine(1518)-N(6)/adenine(1519)-N(6))-dimethyltransferase RsmA [Rickettsiales bacterium]